MHSFSLNPNCIGSSECEVDVDEMIVIFKLTYVQIMWGIRVR